MGNNPLLSLVKPQFGIESGFGVNAAATRLLVNIETFDPSPEQDKSTTGTQGFKYLTRSNLTKETSKHAIKGIFDYIDCGYVFSSVEGLPSEAEYAPLGVPVAGVYQHVWESSPNNADTLQTYTVEFPASTGDRVQKVNGFAFVGYKIGSERDKPMTFETTAIAKALQDIDVLTNDPVVASPGRNDVQTVTLTDATGGTFTIVADNLETTVLAYNATPATVQTAFRLLGGGHATALVSGSAGGPFAITDENGVAVQSYSVRSQLTPNPGASIAVDHTTLGGMKLNPSFEVLPGDISIGWAASMAGLDDAPTTPINQFKTDLTCADRWEFVWRQNPTDVGPGDIKEKKTADQKHVQTMMLGYADEVAAFIANSKALSNGLYFRIKFTGPEILETGVNRSITFDYFCSQQWKTANSEGQGNIRSCEFDLENLLDLEGGYFVRRITAINELPSYATA